MASRKLEDLALPVKTAALELVRRCAALDLEILVYCTLRTCAEQEKLYAMGRYAPGRIRTNAKPGDSLHNPDEDGKAWAFDAVPMVAGVAMWDDLDRLRVMGEIGETVGLEWAGRWTGSLRERVHFQISKSRRG